MLLVAVAIGAACNDDGRRLADAPPPTPTAPAVSEVTGETFQLTSPAFVEAGAIDERFTCDGEDVFPPLAIAGLPPAVVELAVVVVDESADGYVHWVAAGLPATAVALDPATGLPDGTVEGTSDGGIVGWQGPCPPAGGEAHLYRFRVYAFAEPIGIQPGLAGREAVAQLSAAAIASAELSGYYARS